MTQRQMQAPTVDTATLDHLRRTALEHLWIYGQEPSDLAEKGGPQFFVQGQGVRVTDAEGRTFIDGMSGLWLKNVGYGRKEIADAAYQQMLQITYTPGGTTSMATAKLAGKLAEITPGDLSRCFFVTGGSEAVETALKLARAYHKRQREGTRYKVISRKNSYHGATAAAMALGGGGAGPFQRTDYEPLMPGMLYAPQPLPYRCEFGAISPSQCAEKCAQAVEDLILFHGPETVAAVIAEPIASPPGVAVPGPEYWPRLREICTKYGVLLIDDEVICGFGRTGKMFGIQNWGVTPDIMTVAKGITSGYIPMGATIARKEVADAFVGSEQVSFRHIITFGGHPVAAAAALKNIEIIEQEHLVENSAEMGRYMLEQLQEFYDKHPSVGDIRGMGLMVGIELVKDRKTKERFPTTADLRHRVTERLQQNGLITRGGDSIQLMPPLCITRSEVDEVVDIVDRTLTSLEQELGVR